MKKLFLSFIALLSIVLFSSCESAKGPASSAEGTYMTSRKTEINKALSPENYASFNVNMVEKNIKVQIKAVSDQFVEITLPSTTFTDMGALMEIPAITVPNVPVLGDDDGDVELVAYTYTDNDKGVFVKISGEIENDGDIELKTTVKYGKMPLFLDQEYYMPCDEPQI